MQRFSHSLGWHYSDLSDFELKLVVLGASRVLKNNKQAAAVGFKVVENPKPRTPKCPECRTPIRGIVTVRSSDAAKRFMDEAILQLRVTWNRKFRSPIVTYLPSSQTPDASNLYEGPQDALQAAGVIENDQQIQTHDGSDRLTDRLNPRVEITLTPYRGTARAPPTQMSLVPNKPKPARGKRQRKRK